MYRVMVFNEYTMEPICHFTTTNREEAERYLANLPPSALGAIENAEQ